MKRTILIALCCAGLMLVTPLTSIAQENTVSNNLTDKPDVDDDCDICPVVSVISKLVEEEEYQELSNKVFRLKEVKKRINIDPPPELCDFIERLLNITLIPLYFLDLIGSIFIFWILYFPFSILATFWIIIGCYTWVP